MAFSEYDYDNQAWAINGKYVRCGHSPTMNCSCYGKINEGKLFPKSEFPKHEAMKPDPIDVMVVNLDTLAKRASMLALCAEKAKKTLRMARDAGQRGYDDTERLSNDADALIEHVMKDMELVYEVFDKITANR